ncbi:MAG: nitroreductase/quinone reductase family protein [Candidatus Kariarchaeaceae archaeon]|jgi:hypothetical protein
MNHSSDTFYQTNLLYITVKGRKTGLNRTTEIWFTYKDGFIYLLGHPKSQWWRNLKKNSYIQLQIGSRNYKGKGLFNISKHNEVKALFVKKYGASQIKRWYGEDLSDWPVIEINVD